MHLAHPIIFIQKEKNNFSILEKANKDSQQYSYVNILLKKLSIEKEDLQKIKEQVSDVLERVISATNDHQEIKKKLLYLKELPAPFSQDEERLSARKNLLEWLANDNMILLGANSIQESKIYKKNLSWEDFDNNLGVFSYLEKTKNLDFVKVIQKYLPSFASSNLSISFAESHYKAKIHITDNVIFIFNKVFDNNKKKFTFHCLASVFTIAASISDIFTIPLINLKLNKILKKMNALDNQHDFKYLRDIFNKFPKYECFRMENDELRIIAEKSLFIWELENIEVNLYTKEEVGYAHLSIFIPTKYFTNKDSDKIYTLITKILNQSPDKSYWFECGNCVQCHFIYLKYKPKKITKDILKELEYQIYEQITTWQEKFKNQIAKNFSLQKNYLLQKRYQSSFDKLYQSKHTPQQTLIDIKNLEKLISKDQDIIEINTESKNQSTLILYSSHNYYLYQILPKLQNLYLDVLEKISFKICINEKNYYKYTYLCSHKNLTPKERENFHINIQQAFLALFDNKLADEKINGLITYAGFKYQEVNLFSGLKKYMYQLGCPIDSNIFDDILLKNPKINRSILDYFIAKFQPQKNLKEKEEQVKEQITRLKTLTEDNIFRNLYNFIQAMIRTNYYNIKEKEALAFKLDCSKVLSMPNPKPMYEIFVYGIDLTGVHLRGGKIARGGLRFSDRKDDFRTEILGLMNAQMLKNAVIIPEGSKGGFVIDEPFSTREEMFAVVEKHYRRFIQALLSITDNFVQGKVITPKNVVCYDEADPYLVVAADKGTAHLSDVANEISIANNFWLGDGFASGGSVGYNHKEVGITARGAWECVKIHFLELGINIQKEHFSVVGIGDMGGDVFGNGMLLSKTIRLQGAFNHLHIFIDPKPPLDESAWKERKRLFTTPGTSWKDYNPKLISKGGGVFERNAKSIKLSAEVQSFLQTNKNSVSGEELIRMLLTAKVDLLWNGGIGTYAKSKQQTHLDVGDPSNNSVRVNASDLQAKVIGEGGNLGFTQASRLEFALSGGKINADSIDNSAGVNMSDHEVNIKIMIRQLIEKNQIKSQQQRIKLLADLTEEVTDLCLQNNQNQSYILSISQLDSKKNLGEYLTMIDFLIKEKIIDADKETLLEESPLLESGQGLPRPYLCNLLSYTKMYFYRNILQTGLAEDDFFQQYFLEYFPQKMQQKFSLLKYKHRLYNEIITTLIINKQINQFGITFLQLLKQWSNCGYDLIFKSYIIVDNIFNGDAIRHNIFKHYKEKNLNEAYSLLLDLEDFLQKNTLWLLLNLAKKNIQFSLIKDLKRKITLQYPQILFKEKSKLEDLLNLLENQKKIDFPLEKITLIEEKKLSQEKIEEIFIKVYHFFGLYIGERLTRIKVSSNYGRQHIGILLQHINNLKWKIYQKVFKNKDLFLKEPQVLFPCA